MGVDWEISVGLNGNNTLWTLYFSLYWILLTLAFNIQIAALVLVTSCKIKSSDIFKWFPCQFEVNGSK